MEKATSTTPVAPGPTTEDRPLAELTNQLSEQTTRLAQLELDLAKAEVSAKAKRLGIGAGVGLFALGALTATLILALTTFLAPWLAALIVTALYGAIAGVLALTGKRKVDEGTPPVPERAIESTKQDVEHTKRSVKEARS